MAPNFSIKYGYDEATQLVRECCPMKKLAQVRNFQHPTSLPIRNLSDFQIQHPFEGSPQSLYREREKLVRAADAMKNELQTYENNLGFLTASSKKGNSLLTELNRKVEKLKADIELVKQKIKVIDDSIRSAE